MSLKKKKYALRAPTLLLWKMPFEFETPLTFEQCVTKLELLKSLEGSFPIEHVELVSRSEDRMQFQIEGGRSWLGNGCTLGDVQSSGHGALSHVSGTLGIAPSLLFYAPLGFVFIFCLTLFSSLSVLASLSFFFILVCSVFLYGVFLYRAITVRRNLYADLKNLFASAPPPENPFAEFMEETETAEDQLPSAGRRSNTASR